MMFIRGNLNRLCVHLAFRHHPIVTTIEFTSSWTKIESNMKELMASKRYTKAINLYLEHQSCTSISTTLALKACTLTRQYETGVRIHQQISRQLLGNPFVQTSLIHFYMQCHQVDQAEKIFDSIGKKIVHMYGAMFKGYLSNNMAEKVLELYNEMSLKPDAALTTILFNACAKLNNDHAKKIGKKILQQQQHSRAFLENEKSMNSAIDMLMQFGDVTDAEHLFHLLKNKTVITYGAISNGYVTNDLPEKAVDLLENIPNALNEYLHSIIYNACASLANERAVNVGKKLLHQMPKEYFDNITVMTSALDMLMKFGHVQEAERLFQSINNRDIVIYGAMARGYMSNDLPEKALDLLEIIPFQLDEILYGVVFEACTLLLNQKAVRLGKKFLNQMPEKYFDNHLFLNSAIRMLMKFGQVTEAESLYSKMKMPNLSFYNTMIDGYNINRQPQKSLQILDKIKQENLLLDETTSKSLIKTCSQIGLLSTCHRVLKLIPQDIYNDPRLSAHLIDMWGKTSAIDEAKKLFHSISKPNIYDYTTMLNGYGRNGMGTEALDLYHQIPIDMRDAVTHVCVLNACSHSGLIDQAESIFNAIPQKNEYIIGAMVDCYSRMFMFNQAQTLIHQYEQSNPPSIVMHIALLSAARNHRRSNLARNIYDRMRSLFPDQKSELIAASILVSNTYSSVGDYEQSQAIRQDRIKYYGYKVVPGLTWTDVNDELVEFRAHSHYHHPRSAEIHVEVQRMADDLQQHGHEYDASWIIRPLKENESIASVLCGHSEKLAIAYNFIQKPPPSLIQVTKNLRVCGDCHTATKLIAKIRQVEIIVRDANRIHHFHKNGQCSCQDHF